MGFGPIETLILLTYTLVEAPIISFLPWLILSISSPATKDIRTRRRIMKLVGPFQMKQFSWSTVVLCA